MQPRKILKELSFFRDFTDGELDELLQDREVLEIHQNGGGIIQEGDQSGFDLFILVKGTAEVSSRKAGHMTFLQEGAVFGEIGYLVRGPRTSSVTAVGEAIVCRLNDQALDDTHSQLLSRIKNQLLRVLVMRLIEKDGILADKERSNQVLAAALRQSGSGS